MTGASDRADVVVIGAGIVGNSLAYHLARLGVGRIVLVDKGTLPNPGGSTGHASNFIFPFDHSKMMTAITSESTAQYKALGVHQQSGGIEVARTKARMQEFRRKLSAAKAWGLDAELLDPAGVKALVPFLDERVILGGLHFPAVGVVDSLRAGTIMRERAQELGALEVLAGTEVLGIDVDGGRARGVRTSRGEIHADHVVICCGVWSPRIARMAGARLPLTPIVHQMVSVGPIGLFAGSSGEIAYPIVRDVDTGMYERQHGGDMEVGSYAHRPILVDPDDIPSVEASALSPTELPFTADDFDPQMAQALELMPELLGDEKAGVRYAINGLISLTPDGHPLLGETPEVRGLWTAAAIWIKEGPGSARVLAEWMTGSSPCLDASEADVARFWPHQRTRAIVRSRAAEAFNKTYGIVHPAEQYLDSRNVRRSPLHAREVELGASFFETGGWERPKWFEANADLLEEYAGRVTQRHAEWDARWWSPIIEAEHLAMRDRAGLVDLSAFAIFDVIGPGALELLQEVAVAQMDVAVGRVVYTPFLTEEGGFRADLTVMRLAPCHYRVVTGAGHGPADRKWLLDHAAPGTEVVDMTSAFATIGVWGPRARDLVASVSPDDVSPQGFAYGTCRAIELGRLEVLAARISYVGELGWELYVPMEQGGDAFDLLLEAGRAFGARPVGLGVYLSTGRIEKGYRAYGAELTADYGVVEAGLERRGVKKQDFIGKRAHLAERSAPPAARLCTLAVDYGDLAPQARRYPLGGEVVLSGAGDVLVDSHGRRSYVTSAATGPSVGAHLLLAYLPPERARVGEHLLVECMGEQYPVEVVVAGNGAVFDPANQRLRG